MKKDLNIKKCIIGTLGATSLVCSLAFSGCGQRPEEDPMIVVSGGDEAISYNLIPVMRDDVVLTENVRCTYKKNGEQEVHFPVSGKYVDKVYVHEGDVVSKGDVLIELSTGTLEQEIAALKYSIARNELLLSYVQMEEDLDVQNYWINYLFYSGGSEADYDRLQGNLEYMYKQNDYKEENYSDSLEFDRRKLAYLQTQLNESRVYAEIDGKIHKIADNLEGSTSNIEKVVMVIVDNSEGYFETTSPEYVSYFQEGVPVPMNIMAGSGKGDYELVPYNMDEWGDVQTFSIYSGSSEGGIDVGTGGTITVTIDSKKNVLCIPSKCVYEADGDYYVYVLSEDGMREVCWIEVGLYGNDLVEIVSGLEEGDKVIER